MIQRLAIVATIVCGMMVAEGWAESPFADFRRSKSSQSASNIQQVGHIAPVGCSSGGCSNAPSQAVDASCSSEPGCGINQAGCGCSGGCGCSEGCGESSPCECNTGTCQQVAYPRCHKFKSSCGNSSCCKTIFHEMGQDLQRLFSGKATNRGCGCSSNGCGCSRQKCGCATQECGCSGNSTGGCGCGGCTTVVPVAPPVKAPVLGCRGGCGCRGRQHRRVLAAAPSEPGCGIADCGCGPELEPGCGIADCGGCASSGCSGGGCSQAPSFQSHMADTCGYGGCSGGCDSGCSGGCSGGCGGGCGGGCSGGCGGGRGGFSLNKWLFGPCVGGCCCAPYCNGNDGLGMASLLPTRPQRPLRYTVATQPDTGEPVYVAAEPRNNTREPGVVAETEPTPTLAPVRHVHRATHDKPLLRSQSFNKRPPRTSRDVFENPSQQIRRVSHEEAPATRPTIQFGE